MTALIPSQPLQISSTSPPDTKGLKSLIITSIVCSLNLRKIHQQQWITASTGGSNLHRVANPYWLNSLPSQTPPRRTPPGCRACAFKCRSTDRLGLGTLNAPQNEKATGRTATTEGGLPRPSGHRSEENLISMWECNLARARMQHKELILGKSTSAWDIPHSHIL